MATASSVVSRRGNDQFRGLFSDTWAVTCTMNAGSLVASASFVSSIANNPFKSLMEKMKSLVPRQFLTFLRMLYQ